MRIVHNLGIKKHNDLGEQMKKKLTRSISPANPNMPRLTSNKNNPTDGDHVTLTCAPQHNSDVNKYEFFKDRHSLGKPGTSNTLDMKTVTFSNVGGYTCKVYIDTVGSDLSNTVSVKGTNLD